MPSPRSQMIQMRIMRQMRQMRQMRGGPSKKGRDIPDPPGSLYYDYNSH